MTSIIKLLVRSFSRFSFGKSDKGFTLVELLVVISIIGVLSSVVFASLTSAKAKARDARRISDLGQLRTAMYLAVDSAGGSFPNTGSGTFCIGIGSGTCWVNVAASPSSFSGNANLQTAFSASMSSIPTDPRGGAAARYLYMDGQPTQCKNSPSYCTAGHYILWHPDNYYFSWSTSPDSACLGMGVVGVCGTGGPCGGNYVGGNSPFADAGAYCALKID